MARCVRFLAQLDPRRQHRPMVSCEAVACFNHEIVIEVRMTDAGMIPVFFYGAFMDEVVRYVPPGPVIDATAPPGYVERLLAIARQYEFPESYCAHIARHAKAHG